MLGVYDDHRLQYAGNVGTGFTEPMLADGAHWVEPRLIGEVAFIDPRPG